MTHLAGRLWFFAGDEDMAEMGVRRVIVHVIGDSRVRLWGIASRERLRRALGAIVSFDWVEDLTDVASDATVLLVLADYLFEPRTLEALLERRDCALRCPSDGRLSAALVSGEVAATVAEALGGGEAELPEGVRVIDPAELDSFVGKLRKAETPLVAPISEQVASQLEDLLYGRAYKGITDVVTRFVWPRPAKQAVRLCIRLNITPNAVTLTSLALVIFAGYAFFEGEFGLGLAAGWLMTFLDTVDGKLARVTVQSSRFGHYLDHGIDIVHPPFWYMLWGMGLAGFEPVFGLGLGDFYWMIFVAYTAGRLLEGAFDLLGQCSLFAWRPFDAYFRLITARRNPCMIILTAALLAGRPDWGFVAVAAWTTLSTLVLCIRFTQALVVLLRGDALTSWLSDAEQASRRHRRAYRLFASARSAYGRA